MSIAPPARDFYDLSDRVKLHVRGADAARYLQGQLTNDVRRAASGSAVYACLLTAKGRLVADVYLRADRENGFLLDADPTLRESLVARLERYIIADDVTVEDVTDELALLHLPGDGGLTPHAPPDGRHPLPTRADRSGGPGTDVFLPLGEPLAGFQSLLRDQGYLEITPADAEARRVAAGVPRWGAELDEHTLPPEAGLEARAIAYDKGCYVGQETISRLKSLGHVNRHLRRLRALVGPAPLAAGLRLHDPDGGRELGRTTSAAGTLALGYVRHGYEAEGTRLLAADPADEAAAPREVAVAGPPYVPVS